MVSKKAFSIKQTPPNRNTNWRVSFGRAGMDFQTMREKKKKKTTRAQQHI